MLFQYFTEYGPDYQLDIAAGNRPDLNTVEYTEEVVKAILGKSCSGYLRILTDLGATFHEKCFHNLALLKLCTSTSSKFIQPIAVYNKNAYKTHYKIIVTDVERYNIQQSSYTISKYNKVK